jgi:hypothetical protein
MSEMQGLQAVAVAALPSRQSGIASALEDLAPVSFERDMARRRIVTGMPHIDIGRQLREVQRRHGVGPAQMIKEMSRLAAGPGYIGPSEYFIYRLFEQQRDFSEKLAFCGKRMERAMHGACNDPHWVALANDKLVTYSFLSAYGFPVPEVLAFYHPKGRPAPEGVVALGDGVDLDRFLRSIDRPLFGKPLDGYHSLGCVSMVGHDPDGDVVRLAFGQHVAVGTLRDYIERWGTNGYLIQERLNPHPDLAARFGPTQSCVRMIVYLTPGGPELAHAALKIPRGQNFADNSWRGNLISHVDIATGAVTRVVSGGGMDQVSYVDHPDTGQRLLGLVLPNWHDVVRACLAGAASLPGLRTQAWDVAITERGPVLVEVNSKGNFSPPQIASGKGILDERYKAHLQSCGYRERPLSVRVAHSLARRAATGLKA